MNKLRLAVACGLLFLQNSMAVSTLPFYEPFPTNYLTGFTFPVIGAGASAAVWSIGNSSGSLGAVIADFGGSLFYPNLLDTNAYSEILYITGTPNSNRNKGAPFTPQILSSSNRTIYASFLISVFQGPANKRLFATLSSTGSGTTPSVSAGVWLDPSGHLLISKNSNTTPTATNNVNVADGGYHLVVFRYRWNPLVNDDEVALWVDPVALGVDEGKVPIPPASTRTGTDVSTLQSFFINHTTDASVAMDLVLDEIRVATNWAGVTPTTTGVPILPSRPGITTFLMDAASVVLRGTNGSSTGAYQILSATNLPKFSYEWNVVTTRLFDANGNFDFTNAILPGAPRQFYRLLVGGEIPPAPVPPSIITQPTNQTVLVGQSTAFSVVAAGDPTLAYQWFYNTGTQLLNATNASLILTNVQLSDAGGYSVIVTNGSGSITSVVAVLTVNSLASGPSILGQPQSLTVTQGQNAFFAVSASGNPTPGYQWYFNTNTPLLNATNSSLTLTNVQAGDAGVYSVTVANTNGSVSSTNAVLTVLIPVTITNPPADQTIVVGQIASFSVGADGTSPLSYQWYFNTNTLLLNATNASLTATNAGTYSVVVANSINSATSAVVRLTVVSPPIDSGPIGYATVNGTTTGGAGGPTVTVSDETSFLTEIVADGPKIIQVQGTLTFFGNVRVPANMTIVGLGTNATFIGDLDLVSVTNVIIRNLFISNPIGVGDGDGMTIENECDHIWVDHCTFVDCSDGELDITHGSDYVTVSWCRFHYTANTGHNFVNLIGHDQNNAAEDTGKLHISFHHNWWNTLCIERMPRVRFGQVHVFNNYYDCTGNNYCVRAGILSEIRVENNYFNQINQPYEYFFETPFGGQPTTGLINATGNATPDCTNVGSFTDTVFTPPYSYTLETPAAAKAYVLFGAGAGTALFP